MKILPKVSFALFACILLLQVMFCTALPSTSGETYHTSVNGYYIKLVHFPPYSQVTGDLILISVFNDTTRAPVELGTLLVSITGNAGNGRLLLSAVMRSASTVDPESPEPQNEVGFHYLFPESGDYQIRVISSPEEGNFDTTVILNVKREGFLLDRTLLLLLAGLSFASAVLVFLSSSAFIGMGSMKSLMRFAPYRKFYEFQTYFLWVLVAASMVLALVVLKSVF
ncbi:hypothetical protein COT30_03890 [Candidatus Micrarchaeota archaeon CG08_land_8_20_14_0_20_49_17]|nr:MAG: hypothetical protein AUJ13_04470 [Candidatus Micrarchaeota archaeon CG1_02_49_24]PIU09536.1 MAG: hypothetical protein COT30_03890 [Candidatus Micrarchaeota archaeon CG08_land_8_20_14_0_20_49_17]PIU81643.1 MAG: hypothetical protein COS70_03000 [Candidatus Micrarchaeota archaeon CG06_land_8_20_14_3_00_50_6]PIZ97582.1 MAG: hypothetical protein COX84_03025 [Candidatus Micrarchaeota archaeon CG_4_10_14_0_2_um_filter_49_7]HII54343.1 hypothetical protein [Candidatus Micrarchaeota archaeon]